MEHPGAPADLSRRLPVERGDELVSHHSLSLHYLGFASCPARMTAV